jgi:glycosyltransferase involved in cell wall biosynthesis
MAMIAWVLVASIYGGTLVLARLGRRARAGSLPATRRLAIVGTFYNRGWFLSHAMPLARCGIEELLVVADAPQGAAERVRFVCPPAWAVSLLGRTVARLAWLFLTGLRDRPDLYMGYHLMPCAVMALVVARVLGRPAAYQMTGGPLEILDGGAGDENAVLCRLGRSARLLEPLAIRLVAEFDQVVVRGTRARDFLVRRGIRADAIAVIPGSVEAVTGQGEAPRTHELVFAGRLVEIKQPLQALEVLAAVSRAHPSARLLVIGDGPLLPAMRERAAALGLAARTDFVGRTERAQSLLGRGRVFLLTSRFEGLSIAMAEAMMMGTVPVVADVGDLGDLVEHGANGYLVEPNSIDAYAGRVGHLLGDRDLWERLSANAVASARRRVALGHVTALWQAHLDAVFRRATGSRAGVRADGRTALPPVPRPRPTLRIGGS